MALDVQWLDGESVDSGREQLDGRVIAEHGYNLAGDHIVRAGTVVAVAPPADDAFPWTALRPPRLPLSVGRRTRTIPPHLRTALNLRDQGCRFPGCDRPPAWTDGHHIIHWPNDGHTEIDNLVYRQYNPFEGAEVASGSGTERASWFRTQGSISAPLQPAQ